MSYYVEAVIILIKNYTIFIFKVYNLFKVNCMKKKIVLTALFSVIILAGLVALVFSVVGIVGHIKECIAMKSENAAWYDETIRLKLKYAAICLLFLIVSLFDIIISSIVIFNLYDKDMLEQNKNNRYLKKLSKLNKKETYLKKELENIEKMKNQINE